MVASIDGDSLTVMKEGEGEEIRLYGTNCQKQTADFGKGVCLGMVFGRFVEMESVIGDRYGRTVAFVRVGDTLVNEALIRQRLA